MSSQHVSPAQQRALEIIERRGFVGQQVRLSTLKALESKGLVRLDIERTIYYPGGGKKARHGIDYVAYGV